MGAWKVVLCDVLFQCVSGTLLDVSCPSHPSTAHEYMDCTADHLHQCPSHDSSVLTHMHTWGGLRCFNFALGTSCYNLATTFNTEVTWESATLSTHVRFPFLAVVCKY